MTAVPSEAWRVVVQGSRMRFDRDMALVQMVRDLERGARIKTTSVPERYGVDRVTAWRWLLKWRPVLDLVLDVDGYWVERRHCPEQMVRPGQPA